jgi:hypothetical protein
MCCLGGLSSCQTNDDNPLPQSEETTQLEQLKKKLVKGLMVDVSDYMTGDDGILMFNLKEGGTLECADIDEGEEGKEETINILTGKWTAFYEKDSDGTLTPGFNVIFDFVAASEESVDDSDMSEESKTVKYYVLEDEDGMLIPVSEMSLQYLNMLTDLNAGTRADLTIDLLFEIVRVVGKYLLGIDPTNKTLDKEQCQKFWNGVEDLLKEKKLTTTSYNNWMTDIYKGKEDKIRLCDMNIPGSHDSWTYKTQPLSLWASAQNVDVTTQWNNGVRFFDLRVKVLEGKLWVYHGPQGFMSAHDAVEEVMTQIRTHKGETAIITVQEEGDLTMEVVEKTWLLVEDYKDEGLVVRNPRKDMTLKDCAGKVIFMQSWNPEAKGLDKEMDYRFGPYLETDYNKYAVGHIYWSMYAADWKTADKTPVHYQNRCDSKNTSCEDFWKDKQKMALDCWAGFKKETDPYSWCVNQMSGFVGGSILHMTYSKNANVMNPWAVKYVFDHMSEKLGVIQCDFAGSNDHFDSYFCNGYHLPRVVVESNRFRK